MEKYHSEFSIYASVSKVEKNAKGGVVHLFILKSREGAGSNKYSHQGTQLREALGSSWVSVDVKNDKDISSIKDGDLISLGVILSNDVKMTATSSPNRFGLPVKDQKLSITESFISKCASHDVTGDPDIKKLFGVFGDELFDYAINKKQEFMSNGRRFGASMSSLIRFLNNAEKHLAANDAYTLLRRASVEESAAVKITREYSHNLMNHLTASPWYFCRERGFKVQYNSKSRPTNAPKAIIESLDTVYKMINGVDDLEPISTQRAYWIFSMLVNDNHLSGHTAIEKNELIEKVYEKGFFDLDEAERLLDAVTKYGSLMQTETKNGVLISDYTDYQTENDILNNIQVRMGLGERELDTFRLSFQDFLTPEQIQGVQNSLKNHLSVITGGAGTGKTTVIKSIVKNFINHDGISANDILMVAPTGKAKDRMKESTGLPTETIAKVIVKQQHKAVDGNIPFIDAKVVIIDESGMLDSHLTKQLLDVIPLDSHVIFVGDIKQLAPVKHGQPFKDMLVSNYVPSTKLSKPQRTSAESEIHQAAMLVAESMEPHFERYKKDVNFIQGGRDNILLQEILKLLNNGFESKYETTLSDTVVLTPMNVGDVGTRSLNKALKPIMNPDAEGPGLTIYGKGPFHVGDRVIVTKNNSKLDVSNGDVGVVKEITQKKDVVLQLRDKEVTINGKARANLDHAFCLTIHKTQGSEYQTVIMAMSSSHRRMLSPELFYTGITRAKDKFILVSDPKAIEMACSEDNRQLRTTYLQTALESLSLDNQHALSVEKPLQDSKPMFEVKFKPKEETKSAPSMINSNEPQSMNIPPPDYHPEPADDSTKYAVDNESNHSGPPGDFEIPLSAYDEGEMPPDDMSNYDDMFLGIGELSNEASNDHLMPDNPGHGNSNMAEDKPEEVKQDDSNKPKKKLDKTFTDFNDFQF